MNEFSPEQPQAARQFSSVSGTHDPLMDESGLSIEPTPAESRQSTMPTDATDRLAIGEIGAEALAGQHSHEQAGSHDCELVVAPTGQGIAASCEARAGRTLLPAESNIVQNMTTDSNSALTPSEEEVQKPASAPSVQPQSSNGCTPEVASGSPVSTLSNTSENKSEGVNLPAAAEGEPSAEAESGSSTATNSTQTKAMNANKTNPVSSGQAEEDAQGNSCVQTVQHSVELDACAASHGETEQIDSPQAQPPSAVSTDSTNSGAAAIASANLNSGTDFVATTNTNTVMNTTSNTNNVVALASESVSPDFTFTQSEVSPIGFTRTTFTEPQKPGSDWDTVYSGVCVDLMNQGAVTNQLVLKGDKLVLTRPTQLSVCMTVDDHGDLLISNTELADDAIQAAFDAAPALSNDEAIITAFSGSICFHMDLQGTEWQDFDSGAAAWKRPVRTLVLPAGDYFIYGRVTNDPMKGGNTNNRKLFRYAIQAKQVKEEKVYHGDVRQVCNTCGCGNTDSGNADNQAATQAPGWEGDPCPSFVKFNSETGKALYDSPWRWKIAIETEDVVITPPTGDPLYFSIPDETSSEAGTSGASAMVQNRVQYQDSDFNATTSRTPAYIMMKDANGLCMTFDMSNGSVYSITSPEGRKVTATDRAQHVQTQFDNEGNLLSCASAEAKLVCSTADNGDLQLDWFTPDAEEDATTFKQETIQRSGNDTTLTRQQTGRDPHSLVRSESNGVVTITKGAGDEAIVHRYETTYPMNGLMVRTESVYFAATPDNVATCTRSVYNYSDAGWQLYSVTEGFGSDLARSTSYIYNEDNRLTKVQRYDGGYTEYEYDNLGRITMEKSPWGASLAKVTRTTYATARFFDVRPASVTEYHVNASGTEVLFRNTAYSYEDSAELERVTTTVTAGGSSHLQVSIEETFGGEPAYTYAAGKPKFSQDVTGVQTVHEYEATTEHGAIHKHTSTTKANGELVAAQSRRSESFIAANDTTTFTQESIWNGTQWLLLNTTAYEYDEQQRVVKTTRGNGRFSTTTWMCCGRLSETDEDGITTTYAYDSARQLSEISREEVYDGETCITPETITEYIRDAAGRVLTTIRRVGPMKTTESTEYDALGRVTKQTDILGRVTTATYSEDGLTTTVVNPAGATSITTRHADGSSASVSGTAQRALMYVYDLNGNSLRTTTKLADGTTIAQSIVNGFGQTTVQAQASNTGFIYSRSEFNAKDQMVKQYQDTGWNTEKTAPTLFEYDSFGNITKQTLALSDTPTKDNSPVVEMAYSVESAEDGVYSVTTQTRYNASGEPLSTVQKQLVSHLSATLANKRISTDERGNSSTNWAVYSDLAKVTSYSDIPTSTIIAESIVMDGFTLSQKDYAGIISTSSRTYTASGMTLVHVDGRNNATTSITDIAGRTISSTDASGGVTTTLYDAVHNLPAVITDAMGNTTCFKYDRRGRKIAEWGTAIQPACFGYDEMGNMTYLRTFRAGTETISTDPSERTDGDVTTWEYHPATGLVLSKTYADGTTVVNTFDDYNRLTTETDARGNEKTHSYEHARGLHLGTTYTLPSQSTEGATAGAATSARSFNYNHLGQLTQVTDDAGTRSFGYNSYGERETDSLVVDGDTHLITEQLDSFGRSVGYIYSKNGTVQQTVSTGYGSDGRISSAGFLHGGEAKNFGYTYLAGTNLLQGLSEPNGMTLSQTYEATRDLLTDIAYHRGSTLVARRTYTYDILGRPTARNTSRQGAVVNDTFVHNNRSELARATVNGADYDYDYDNIGNRRMSTESGDYSIYESNALNQYISISENGADTFVPQFDADGNQTLCKTSTGIWSVVYNAESRPVSFTNEATGTVVTCAYDSMGRRCFKMIKVNGTITLHQRYLYRGYLQIACIDLTRSHHPTLWLITWDPSQPVATRPLAIQKDGTWYTYGWDLTKNICELYRNNGYIATTYTYTPYGGTYASGSIIQPIQWSSEFADEETQLISYNYRYYNYNQGGWISRDSMPYFNLYQFVVGNPIFNYDSLGLAHLNHHITAAQEYARNKSISAENKVCFEFGSIWPDIPDVDFVPQFIAQPDVGYEYLNRKIKWGFDTFGIDEYDIRSQINTAIYNYFERSQRPKTGNAYIEEIKQIIMGVINQQINKITNKIPDFLKQEIKKGVNKAFKDFLRTNMNRTYQSHFGNNAEYHAMAENETIKHQETFNKYKDTLTSFLNTDSTCCQKWENLGKVLHMLTDLNTHSHAKIKTDGERTIVEHFFFYHENDNSWHAGLDNISKTQITASVNLFSKVLERGFDNVIDFDRNTQPPQYPLHTHM